MNRRLLCVLAAAVALCAARPDAAFAQQDGARPPAPAPATGYTVRPGDVLRIRVWPDSSLSGEFPVEETGYTYLPVLGAVRAGGVPLEELRRNLRQLYGGALKAPAVEVTPLFKVSVLGAVMRPGLYSVDPSQTLFDAISLAGGFQPNAKEKEVRLIRHGQSIRVNAEEELESGSAALDLALQSGDRVVVPQGHSVRALDIFYGIQSLVLIVTLVTRVH